MFTSIFTVSALVASLGISAPAPMPQDVTHVTPLPGKCTIGIEAAGASYPNDLNGQGETGTVNMHDAWGFIVGTDGVMTKTPAEWEHVIVSDGSYGGIGGGDFHAEAVLSGPTSVANCNITFRGQTFNADSVDKGTCDYYSKGGAFTAKGGCRCRFDCQ